MERWHEWAEAGLSRRRDTGGDLFAPITGSLEAAIEALKAVSDRVALDEPG